MIERVWRSNWGSKLNELRDALEGRDDMTLEMHLVAEVGKTLRWTLRP
jgi:hypothetical protein